MPTEKIAERQTLLAKVKLKCVLPRVSCQLNFKECHANGTSEWHANWTSNSIMPMEHQRVSVSSGILKSVMPVEHQRVQC